MFERHSWPAPAEPHINRPNPKENPMKKLILVIASAAPVLAEGFPNYYMTR